MGYAPCAGRPSQVGVKVFTAAWTSSDSQTWLHAGSPALLRTSGMYDSGREQLSPRWDKEARTLTFSSSFSVCMEEQLTSSRKCLYLNAPGLPETCARGNTCFHHLSPSTSTSIASGEIARDKRS